MIDIFKFVKISFHTDTEKITYLVDPPESYRSLQSYVGFAQIETDAWPLNLRAVDDQQAENKLA
jgi:hypothetical protein